MTAPSRKDVDCSHDEVELITDPYPLVKYEDGRLVLPKGAQLPPVVPFRHGN